MSIGTVPIRMEYGARQRAANFGRLYRRCSYAGPGAEIFIRTDAQVFLTESRRGIYGHVLYVVGV